MMLLGETLERHVEVPYLSAPASPLLNIYLPHLLYLAKTQLRIGHALTRRATREQAKNRARYGVMPPRLQPLRPCFVYHLLLIVF